MLPHGRSLQHKVLAFKHSMTKTKHWGSPPISQQVLPMRHKHLALSSIYSSSSKSFSTSFNTCIPSSGFILPRHQPLSSATRTHFGVFLGISSKALENTVSACSHFSACWSEYPWATSASTLLGSCFSMSSKMRRARWWCLGGYKCTKAVARTTLNALRTLRRL